MEANWGDKLKLAELKKGNLPPVQVPQSGDSSFNVKYNSKFSLVACYFTISAQPLDPVGLAFHDLPSALPVGAELRPIQLSLVDEHNNIVPFRAVDFANVVIKPMAKTIFDRKRGVIQITSVNFSKVTLAGETLSLEATFGQFPPAFASIHLIPGEPKKLICLRPNPETINFHVREIKSEVQFEFNLVDEYSNVCAVSGKQVFLNCFNGSNDANWVFKFTPDLKPRKLKDGVISFGPYTVRASQKGSYYAAATVDMGDGRQFCGKVNLIVQASPDEPAYVEFEGNFPLRSKAGAPIHNAAVRVFNADRQNLTKPLEPSSVNATYISFEPIPNNNRRGPWSPRGVDMSQITREVHNYRATRQQDAGLYFFEDVKMPTVAGEWRVRIFNQGRVSSQDYLIDVEPTDPFQLLLDPPSDTLCISNGRDLAKRTLISKGTRLLIIDKYGNELLGKTALQNVNIRILSANRIGSRGENLPKLANALASGEIVERLDSNGIFPNDISIVENTECEEGKEYQLGIDLVDNSDLKLCIIFTVENDYRKMAQRQAQEVKRQKLVHEKNQLQEQMGNLGRKVEEMNAENQQYEREIEDCKVRIFTAAEYCEQVVKNGNFKEMSDAELERYIKRVQENITEAANKQRVRRQCRCRPPDTEPGVVGKVAQLATIESDDVCRVISWQLASKMDAVITETKDKMEEILRRSRCAQQCNAIELFNINLPQWDAPLPHANLPNRERAFPPEQCGNPKYARSYLKIQPGPYEKDMKRLFTMILGDTIVIENRSFAMEYRKRLLAHRLKAPTMLCVNDGSRLDSMGFAGGASNNAPALPQLSNYFGVPPSKTLSDFTAVLEALEKLQSEKSRLPGLEYNFSLKKAELQNRIKEANDERRELSNKIKAIDNQIGTSVGIRKFH